jgi:hypothetical protein
MAAHCIHAVLVMNWDGNCVFVIEAADIVTPATTERSTSPAGAHSVGRRRSWS